QKNYTVRPGLSISCFRLLYICPKLLLMLSVHFLQIVTDTLQQLAAPLQPEPAQELSLWYLMKEGGILMIPLLICSILAIYFFVERWIAIRKAGKTPGDFMARVKEKITDGNISGAVSLCKNYEGALPHMILKGVNRIGKPVDHIE